MIATGPASERDLPTAGVRECLGHAVVARENGRLVGCAALEVYADGALLRSVAVDERLRGRGVGHQLTEAALALARQAGAPAAFLLTTTAGEFFPRFGFERITRDEVPAGVRDSIEFTSACPCRRRWFAMSTASRFTSCSPTTGFLPGSRSHTPTWFGCCANGFRCRH